MLTCSGTTAIVAAIAAAALGVPASALPASAVPAASSADVAASTTRGCDAVTTTGASLRGSAAVTELGASLPSVAAHNAMPAAALATALRTDSTVRIDPCGNVLYVDQPAPAGPLADEAPALSTHRSSAGLLDARGNAFTLSSRPGSRRTIYLDFVGYTLSGTAWNSSYGLGARYQLPAYDSDGNPGAFSAAELAAIREVWLRVAEDYAPFDVNVTTRDPGVDAIARTDDSDQVYGTRAVISSSASFARTCGCGGVAYLSSIGLTGVEHDYYQPVLVMTANLRNGWAKAVAEAASHEVGHSFGLSHDGITGGTAYYEGAAGWAPIMGVGYYQPLTQWSKGEYAGANNGQDDLAIIARNAPLVTDDHGGAAATATPLTPGSPTSGLIGSAQDQDWFSFTALGGAVTVVVAPAAVGADLDAELQVLDAEGTVVADVNPTVSDPVGDAVTATGLGASYHATLPPGAYVARVTGAGQGAPRTGGWSAYASLGRYSIDVSGSVVAPLSVATTVMADATAGQPYTARLVASGALGATRWSVPAGSLPGGLVLNPATGAITGRPTSARAVALPVTVTDAGARSVTRTVRLTVRAPLRVTTAGLVAAHRASAYRVQLTATGGAGRTYWRLRSGTLPRGVVLTASGLLRGRPVHSGVYRLTVLVVDAASGAVRPGHSALHSYRFVVR